MKSLGCAAAVLFVSSCSSGGHVTPARGSSDGDARLESLLRHPAAKLLARGRELAPGFRADLPRRASEPFRVSVGADFWVETSGSQQQYALPSERDGLRYFADPTSSGVDRAFVTGGAVAEELLVLRTSEHRVRVMDASLRVGPAVRDVRVREGRIELLDAAGVVRLSAGRPWAVDALGVRRDVDASVRTSESGDGFVLSLRVDDDGLTAPIVVDPAWTSLSTMPPRLFHLAVRLTSGRVLVAGGKASFAGTELGTSDLYDPATNTWSAVAGYGAAVSPLRALLPLPGDRALAVGDSSMMRYDRATNTWTSASTGYVVQQVASFVALGDGRIAALGGVSGTTTLVATQLFNPTTEKWTAGPNLPVARYGLTAVTLSTGKVLVGGGVFRDSTTGVDTEKSEAFSFDGTTFTPVAALPASGSGIACVAFDDGRVAVVDKTPSLYVSDAAIGTWTKSKVTPLGTMAPLPGGRLFFTADFDREVFSRSIDALFPLSPPPGGMRRYASFTPLSDGRLLVAGGGDGASVATGNSETLQIQANGAACGAVGDCASTACTDGVCCERACDGACETCAATAGKCTARTGSVLPGHKADCAPYAMCNAGACATMCATTADCALGNLCLGGTCIAAKARGATCASDAECATAHCVDGVCCSGTCTGVCEACDLPASLGVCSPVSGAPRAGHGACAGAAGACGERCDGTDGAACHLVSDGAPCGGASCKDGTETHASTCDGKGACGDVPRACGSYVCGADACKTSCAADGDCAGGTVCRGEKCVPKPSECTADGLSVKGDSADVPCNLYVCRSGACLDACVTSGDCSPGNVCASGGTCVPAAPEDDGGGGCAVAPLRSESGGAVLGALAILGLFVRRRGYR